MQNIDIKHSSAIFTLYAALDRNSTLHTKQGKSNNRCFNEFTLLRIFAFLCKQIPLLLQKYVFEESNFPGLSLKLTYFSEKTIHSSEYK